jgi:hypothetical protein
MTATLNIEKSVAYYQQNASCATTDHCAGQILAAINAGDIATAETILAGLREYTRRNAAFQSEQNAWLAQNAKNARSW